MALEIFGYKILKNVADEEPAITSFSTKESDDGAVVVTAGGTFATYLDVDGAAKTEAELITKYRDISLNPEVEVAINHIISEAIVKESKEDIVDIDLDGLKFSDDVKEKILKAWHRIYSLYNFNNNGYEIFKRWYVDGRIVYHKMVNKNDITQGIQELRYIDPRKIRLIRSVKRERKGNAIVSVVDKEFYMFNDKGFKGSSSISAENNGLSISPDSIIHVTSGQVDKDNRLVLSYLHKSIKPLNQLRVLEDATIIYRISRAPERRVFQIDVGNLPKMKAEQHVRDIMTKHRNRLIYDSADGCFAMDTKVALLDGRTLSISEIEQEMKEGKQLWTYSCNPETGEIVPGMISWAGMTRKNQKVMRLTFDNDESVICTLDHKFPILGKGFVEAKDLVLNESMIPLYKKEEPLYDKTDYEKIWQPNTKKWQFTHKMVSSWKDTVGIVNQYTWNEEYKNKSKNAIHHKDFNRFNNSPTNLVRMDYRDHFAYHSVIGKKQMTEESMIRMKQLVVENLNEFCRNHNLNRTNIKHPSRSKQYHASILKNHKLIKIEYLDEAIDVGTLTIDREEQYHDYHTFALAAGVFTKNSIKSDRKYATMLEDYWFPRRADGSGTQVTTLESGRNQGQLDDVEYFEKKLYQSLNIPVSRMNPDSPFNLGRASEITRDELIFQKFIMRLRLKFSEIFFDALKTQLILTNTIAEEEWEYIRSQIHFNFKVDNYFAELKNSEILKERINTLSMVQPFVGLYYSVEWVKKNILFQTEDDVIEIQKQIDQEAQAQAEKQAQEQDAGGEAETPPTQETDDNISSQQEFDPSEPQIEQ